MGLVSIIVPIYKVEAYLERCIQSIINQTWKDFELILVDDGSPDGCPGICDRWEQKDERIKVIHKENGGLSDARNIGLKYATGEYIAFVDSDDWIAEDYLELLIAAMEHNECDIVECGIIRTKGENDAKSLKLGEYSISSIFQTEQALVQLINDACFHQYVWNKLYKRNIIKDIWFEKGKTNEDEFWTYQAFGNAKLIGKIENPLYYYFQRSSSIMGEGYSLKRLDALEAKANRQIYIEKKYPKIKDIAKVNLFTSCIYQGQLSLLYLKEEELKQAKMMIHKIALKAMPTFSEYSGISLGTKVWITAAKNCFWGTCKIKNILKKGF